MRGFPRLSSGYPENSELAFFCTGGEARTPDTWFWRPVLYQLSYTRRPLTKNTNKPISSLWLAYR